MFILFLTGGPGQDVYLQASADPRMGVFEEQGCETPARYAIFYHNGFKQPKKKTKIISKWIREQILL